MRWTAILGHSVVDTKTAETVGTIDALVADPDASQVVAFLVAGRAVSWSDAGGIGSDALTLSDGNREGDLLHPPSSDLELRAVAGAGDPLGKRVITELGHEIGSIEDLEVDAETGAIGQLILADDQIKGSRLIGIGSFAVMISSPSRARTGDADGADADADGLDSLSRAELYELAQERDVVGRSSMSKEELIEALS